MITKQDLNRHEYPTTSEIDTNLDILLARLQKLETEYGSPFIITSGLRSEEQQLGLIRNGLSNAVHSKHLIGAAADIADVDGALNKWCMNNSSALEEVGLWCEVRQGPWQHLQILPPASQHRWFNP
jgi:uncharacterized protein YcbK (DUF882 family)